MLRIIQDIHIKYEIWKFEKLRKFGEAVVILKHAAREKSFPHGDAEYSRILNQEGNL